MPRERTKQANKKHRDAIWRAKRKLLSVPGGSACNKDKARGKEKEKEGKKIKPEEKDVKKKSASKHIRR